MSENPPKDSNSSYDPYLKGTTYKIYRYMLKQGEPIGISKVQKDLA